MLPRELAAGDLVVLNHHLGTRYQVVKIFGPQLVSVKHANGEPFYVPRREVRRIETLELGEEPT